VEGEVEMITTIKFVINDYVKTAATMMIKSKLS